MAINKEYTEKLLCSLFCATIKLHKVEGKDCYFIETPFIFPDGDSVSLYLIEEPFGFRLTDFGHTLMHLSYDNDVDIFEDGTRGKLLAQILAENGVKKDGGTLYIDTDPQRLVAALFHFGQTVTRVTDLDFLNRSRTESTFYEDLKKSISTIVPAERVRSDYIVPGVSNAEDYPVDYKIEGKAGEDVYLFGIPGRDKAKDTALTLEHLLRVGKKFESILIFENQGNIPRFDLARLSNVGGEQIASLDAYDDLKRKLLNRVPVN